MTIAISKIITTKDPYQPAGKNYKVFSWIVSGKLDFNKEETVLEVKSFKQITLDPGVTLDVEKQEYMGKVTYKITGLKRSQVQSSDNLPVKQSSQKVNYTLDEYNDLFLYAWGMFEHRVTKIPDPAQRIECLQKLISTYIISAVQNGVKIPQNIDFTQTQASNRQNLLNNQGAA